jgi:hypothetical protein
VETHVALGVLAGLLSVGGAAPYLRDVLRGTTVPHRGAWLVWTVLGCIALAAQVSAGAGWGATFLWVQTAGMVCTLALAVRRGVGGTRPLDLAALGLAAAGVVGWQATDSPLAATVCVCVADAVGFALVLPKAWRDPWSETSSTYLLAALSGACPLLVVSGGLELVLYPAWFVAANALVTVVLVRRRSVLGPVRPAARHAAADRPCPTCATGRVLAAAPWSTSLLPGASAG